MEPGVRVIQVGSWSGDLHLRGEVGPCVLMQLAWEVLAIIHSGQRGDIGFCTL